jgi:hypothetical protein
MELPTRVNELVERLARLTGEDPHTAVARVIEERLARVCPATSAHRKTAIAAFFQRLDKMPVIDNRTPDDILGYGPHLPD